MTLPVFLRPLAVDDIRAAFADFERLRPGLGKRFARSLLASLDRIADMPQLYGIVWKNVRAARIRKFRHVAYYVAYADRVEVIAVLHGARDSSTWQERA